MENNGTTSPKKSINLILGVVLGLLFASVIFVNFRHFYVTKNYDYVIEMTCDPQSENCAFRDCENNPDSCPPNNLSYYKTYNVKAYDFAKCADNSCKAECDSGAISCTQISCDESGGDICTTPETYQTNIQ